MPLAIDNIDRASLLSIVSTCARIISPKAYDIAQRAIRLSAREGILTAESTDTEISVKASIPCPNSSDGSVLVSGKLLHDLLKTLPGDAVSIKVDEVGKKTDMLVLRGKGSKARYKLHTLDVDEFPEFPPMPEDAISYTVDARLLGTGLKQVARFSDDGRLKPHLGGVLFSLSGQRLRLVATNTYFFGIRDLEAKSEALESKVTTPNDLVAEAMHALGDADTTTEAATVTVSGTQIRIAANGVEFVSRLIELPYPRYSHIIPTMFQNELTVDRDEMLAIIRRLAYLVEDLTPVKFFLSDNEVRASSTEKGIGSGDEAFETAAYSGDKMIVAYNPKLLFECVGACEGEKIVVRNLDNIAPALIVGEGHDEAMFICSPIRLKEGERRWAP